MIGKTVEIIPSEDLKGIRLSRLVGRQGTVVARSKKGNGFYVALQEPYMDETEWFIPKSALQIVSR